jgi:RHS repeat-associated protein
VVFNYTYDPVDNLISVQDSIDGVDKGIETFAYDELDRVTSITQSGDVFDRRIGKSVDSNGDGVAEKVERFVLDGDHIALTFDGDGNQTERFLHGARIDEVIAQENASGEVLWALTDNLGSVRVLLDNDGNVVNQITYDAFGNITVESNPDVNFRFGYTGRELDSETGLYYYRSRYYDPAVGQFINEDTIGFAGGDSNLYRYTFNSPLNYRDPDGKLVWAIPVAVGTAIVFGGILYQLKKSTEALVEDLPKVFPKDNPWTEQDPNQKPKKPKEPPKAPWIEETDPLKINPEKKNDDFFNPDKPDSWFDKQKELTEEVKEENEKKEEDNNSGTCPAPWASNDHNPNPQASNEPQDGDNDDSNQSSNNNNPDNDLDTTSSNNYPFDRLPKGSINSNDLDLEALKKAANEPLGKGGLTVAGRALDKHAQNQRPDDPRGTGVFPPLSGNNQNKNKIADQQINEILNSPDAAFKKLGKGGIESRLPDGRGVRFNKDGSFSGFVN